MRATVAAPPATARLSPAMIVPVALGILLPWLGLSSRWLWLDELLSANFAAHGPWVSLVTVLRFDVHPPLYYLQLSLWMLAGQSDSWLMANSILWHTAAIALLSIAAGRIYTPRIGLAAGLLLALSPAALVYADQVRMYAFLTFLIVWAWYAQARWLNATAGRLGPLWMVLSQAAVTNSHTAGLLMLSGLVASAGIAVLRQGRGNRIVHWLLIESGVLLLSALPLLLTATRGVTHLRMPGWMDLVSTWSFLAGGLYELGAVGILLGLLVISLLVIFAVHDWRPILPGLAAIVIPLLLTALISHTLRPAWILTIFVPLIPLLCLALARGALTATTPLQPRAMLLAGLAATWLFAGLWGQYTRQKGDGFRPEAEAIHRLARPGDTILIDGDFTYWCFMWYFAGPDWGEARHASIPNPAWAHLIHRLPPALVSSLNLSDTDGHQQRNGRTLELLDRTQPPLATPTTLVVRPTASPPFDLPAHTLTQTTAFTNLILERWTPQTQTLRPQRQQTNSVMTGP